MKVIICGSWFLLNENIRKEIFIEYQKNNRHHVIYFNVIFSAVFITVLLCHIYPLIFQCYISTKIFLCCTTTIKIKFHAYYVKKFWNQLFSIFKSFKNYHIVLTANFEFWLLLSLPFLLYHKFSSNEKFLWWKLILHVQEGKKVVKNQLN